MAWASDKCIFDIIEDEERAEKKRKDPSPFVSVANLNNLLGGSWQHG